MKLNALQSNLAIRVLKWALFLLVLGFVGWKGWELWVNSDVPVERIRLGWLVAAGGCYIIGWLPCAWMWQRLLQQHDSPVSFLKMLPAHYCGHLGKYVPGKAMVLVIRAAMVKPLGVKPPIAVLTATYETLASMAVGALGVVLLLPVLWSPVANPDAPSETTTESQGVIAGMIEPIIQRPVLFSTLAVAITLAILPFTSRTMTAVAKKITKSDTTTVEMPLKLLVASVVILGIGWWIHGLSLACVMIAVGADESVLLRLPVWTLAVTAGVVMGFIALIAPGGLGIREAFITAIIQQLPDVSDSQAIAAAILLRIVWFTTEVIIASALYWKYSRWNLSTEYQPETPPETPSTASSTA